MKKKYTRWHVMNIDNEIAYFDIDEVSLKIKNYTVVTDNMVRDEIFLPFRCDVTNPCLEDLLEFFDERLTPRTRFNIDEILEGYGLNSYNPVEFIHATHGIMFEDYQWVRFDDEKLTFKDVDHFKRIRGIETGLLNGTSKGNQQKFVKNNMWYKIDEDYESLAEVLCCRYLRLFNFSIPVDICNYIPVSTGAIVGCISDSFTTNYENVVTLYRLLLKRHNKQYYRNFDKKPEDTYKIFVELGSEYYSDFGYYLSLLFLVDLLIRNEDRHTNNIALIRNANNVYRPTPIFDNGNALYQSVSREYSALECLNKYKTAKPLGLSFEQQYRMANYYFPVSTECINNVFDLRDIVLDIYPSWLVNRCIDVLRYTTKKYFNIELVVLLK